MTLEQIEQRLDELKEELDNLADEMAQIEAEETEQSEVKPWMAEYIGQYFYLDSSGTVMLCAERHFENDCFRHHIGNYYRTRELAEQDAKELALRGRVRQLRDALCEGYQFVPYEINYCVAFSHTNDEFCVLPSETINDIGVIYFDTKDHAQQACDILNAEYKND